MRGDWSPDCNRLTAMTMKIAADRCFPNHLRSYSHDRPMKFRLFFCRCFVWLKSSNSKRTICMIRILTDDGDYIFHSFILKLSLRLLFINRRPQKTTGEWTKENVARIVESRRCSHTPTTKRLQHRRNSFWLPSRLEFQWQHFIVGNLVLERI